MDILVEPIKRSNVSYSSFFIFEFSFAQFLFALAFLLTARIDGYEVRRALIASEKSDYNSGAGSRTGKTPRPLLL